MSKPGSTASVEDMVKQFEDMADADPNLVASVFERMGYPTPHALIETDFEMDPEGTPPPGGVGDFGDEGIQGGEFVKKHREFFLWKAMKKVGRKTRRGWQRIKPSRDFMHSFAQILLGFVIVGSLIAGLTWLYTVAPLAAVILAVGMLAQIVASILAFSAITYVEYRNQVGVVVNGTMRPSAV